MIRVPGSDVSAWQGVIDHATFVSHVKFVFMRAGFGGYNSAKNCKDRRFDENMAGFGQHDVLRGTYWFGNYMTYPERQAQWYAEVVNGNWGELPPMLDLEWYWKPYPNQLNLLYWMKVFMEKMDEYSGRETIFYCNPSMLKYLKPVTTKVFPDWLLKRTLSVAHYTTADQPSLYGFPAWRFWQYTDRGPGKEWGTQSAGLDLQWGDADYLKQFLPSEQAEEEPVNEDRTLEERVTALEEKVEKHSTQIKSLQEMIQLGGS